MHKKRSDRSFAILGVVIFCVVAFSGRDVCADGKHFPEKAYKAAPAIPSQRAILTYKDGIERLTIESAFDGQGQEFGWVIPLPSKPTEFEKTSPGLIKTFSLVLQPEIVHDLSEKLWALCRIAALVAFGSLIFVASKYPDRILWLILFFVVFVGLFMPSLGTRLQGISATDTPGVKIHDVRQVGSYELAVLETENSQALDAWLENNGFVGLSKEDEKIVSDYVKDGWYFVVAKLRREGDGCSRPHPLSMSFPSDKPVYPMRLTATVGSDVYLELYVIADRQATCEVLTLEVSDEYRFREERESLHSDRIIASDFVGKAYKQGIRHSDASRFMWDGCVVSKLCAMLTPGQMGEDIILQLKTGEPSRKHYYSRRGARDTALATVLGIWCVLPVLLAVIYHRKRKEPSGKSVFVKKILVPSVLLSFLLWALHYAILPKIDVRTLKGGRIRAMLEVHRRTTEIAMLADEHDDFAGMSKDQIAQLVGDWFTSKKATNIYSGEPLRCEDSPGDYTIVEDDRGIVWRMYSMNGYPEDHVLRPAAED